MVDIAERPALQIGSHTSPEDGVCVMEWVSVVTRDRFTDFPGCTDRYIACLAQNVNDWIGPDSRQVLHQFVPRLMRARRAVVTLEDLLTPEDNPSVRLHELIEMGRDRLYRNSWKPFWERSENAEMLHITDWHEEHETQVESLRTQRRPGETREQLDAALLGVLDRALTYHMELLAKEDAF